MAVHTVRRAGDQRTVISVLYRPQGFQFVRFHHFNLIHQIDQGFAEHMNDKLIAFRKLIQIRKQFPCLRLETKEEVQYYLETSEIDYRMILFVYHMDMEGYNQLQIYVNPSDNIYPVFLGDGEYELIADQRGSVNQKLSDNNVKIAPVSIAIFARIDQ